MENTPIKSLPIYISQKALDKDTTLQTLGARKIIVSEIYPEKETILKDVAWQSAKKCPVKEMNGLELAVFNQNAPQDKHYHKAGTEIYTVLAGEMKIEVDGTLHHLATGDAIVIPPRVIHEVKKEGKFQTQVILANGNSKDKVTIA